MLHATEQLRPDVQQRRRWWDILLRKHVPTERLVFLDETSVHTGLLRLYGWGETSQRVVDHQPLGHWKTFTFLCALRTTGLCAPLLLEGAMTGDAFAAWVEQFLAPTLKRGDRVILDNASPHFDERVERLVYRTGAKLLYLPPYSPDLNPIENAYSKLKTLLRKAGARTFETLCASLAGLLDRFSPGECLKYITHCGY